MTVQMKRAKKTAPERRKKGGLRLATRKDAKGEYTSSEGKATLFRPSSTWYSLYLVFR
ncbi:hypothetical protein SCLCIDRAFT_1210250 [Scleroderma citrinum Foug A]|uniref:Uncharacterized protein n=1 Tax=Scleroderma citrinum Foug A TaxID=1036808 RepID=A0A0C3EH79_9AGAM|nr:hypothetical protein SCLCIDRAFT_1210250 [Scleroderma citrinum Foug A]